MFILYVIYIYIYIFCMLGTEGGPSCSSLFHAAVSWLRTHGVNTIGAAAKVVNFDRLGKKVRPGTFGKIKVGERESPKVPL